MASDALPTTEPPPDGTAAEGVAALAGGEDKGGVADRAGLPLSLQASWLVVAKGLADECPPLLASEEAAMGERRDPWALAQAGS